MSHQVRVAVVRGGQSNEYEVSLKTGANVLGIIREKYPQKYRAYDVLIDRQGNWHLDGLPVSSGEVCTKSDVIFNALHGAYGEDGKIQHLFESHNMPFTGSGSSASAVSMNKMLAKQSFGHHDIQTPAVRIISADKAMNEPDALTKELFQILILPVIVKPIGSGSSVGVTVVRDYPQLPEALRNAAAHGDVMIEDFIPGIEATCGVLENFRGHELYALPPIEIRHSSHFFDYDAKYSGASQEIVPATFPDKFKHAIQEMAKKIHSFMGLRHYSRSDFIIHPRRGIYALEVNTLPGLTAESLMPKAMHAIGSSDHEFVDHVIGLALSR